ncbi:MAG: putative baseplate assembly protein [Acidimicrobiales bacterium]|nr:putative baseplate assembly protein [Acidimicrobiales bacterium]
MALPSPDLDDRRFQDLVDEAKRLIPRHCPEWTNHNVSDPGVALIELFAWMSEMVLYRLNQVPDRYYTKFLELVGVELFPPSVARADLTFWLSSITDDVVRVPAATEVATTPQADGSQVIFSTERTLEIRQPELVASLTAGADEEQFTDVWDALRYERDTVMCFGSEPMSPGDAFYLGFSTTLAGNLLRLDVEASIEGIGVDPSRPPLAWEVWSGEAWIPAKVHEDSTGGLNRDGFVILVVPLEHAPLTLGGTRGYWLRARLTVAAADQPQYQASPQVRRILAASLGGTVQAEHSRRVESELLGRSDGSPGQVFRVANPPVLPRQTGEHIEVLTPDGVEQWQEVVDFADSGPADRHITFDGASGQVKFGPRIRYPDGGVRQHGAIPPEGAEIILAAYRTGGGAIGNVGSGTLRQLRTTIPYIDRVTNLVPARGGADAESVENAKQRGPMSLRTGQRAVTARDFERLTVEASAEVARARCLPSSTPGGPIRMLVVPRLAAPVGELDLDDFALSNELVDQIGTHLDERRLVGTRVEIGTPYYQGVTVAALLRSLPGRPAGLVRQRALDALYRFINPLTGGTDDEGWPFDTDLNAASVAQLIEAIDGVDRVEEILFFEYDLRTGVRHGTGRELIRLDDQSLFLSAHHQVVVR